jgi:hypothetical protein
MASTLLAARSNPIVLREAARVRVALPQELLSDKEIQKELRSGLTTTFILTAVSNKLRGGARIELRYELWDEVYLVRVVSVDGTEERARLTAVALPEWWNVPRAIVFNSAVADTPLQLQLDVLPFSASEEADAKRWLAQSARTAAQNSAAAGDGRGVSSPLLDAVIGTSVRRKPLLSYVWHVRMSSAHP